MRDRENTIKFFKTTQSLNQYVVDETVYAITNNVNANIMLSGGNSPKPILEMINLFGRLSKNCRFIPSDERRVPTTDELSNERMIRECLRNYDNSQFISLQDPRAEILLNEIPQYELGILGMGVDGHFASIFPKMKNLKEALTTENPLCMVDTGFPDVKRTSCTLKEVLKAKKIILLVADQEKLKLLKKTMHTPSKLPISELLNKASRLEVLTIGNKK